MPFTLHETATVAASMLISLAAIARSSFFRLLGSHFFLLHLHPRLPVKWADREKQRCVLSEISELKPERSGLSVRNPFFTTSNVMTAINGSCTCPAERSARECMQNCFIAVLFGVCEHPVCLRFPTPPIPKAEDVELTLIRISDVAPRCTWNPSMFCSKRLQIWSASATGMLTTSLCTHCPPPCNKRCRMPLVFQAHLSTPAVGGGKKKK